MFEEKWKIKTNIDKFPIIRLGANRNVQIIIDQDAYMTQNQGRILGLKVTRQGYTKHIEERKKSSYIQPNKTIPIQNYAYKH